MSIEFNSIPYMTVQWYICLLFHIVGSSDTELKPFR